MATGLKNLSDYNPESIPSGKDFHIGIVVSEWNDAITGSLLEGAIETLLLHQVDRNNISILTVPGSFELPSGAQTMFNKGIVDGVICLGCVIRGETSHFDFICDACANGVMRVALDNNKPCIFGVLTTENQQQALDRCGGKHGNKGIEAAITILKMIKPSFSNFV